MLQIKLKTSNLADNYMQQNFWNPLQNLTKHSKRSHLKNLTVSELFCVHSYKAPPKMGWNVHTRKV